MEMHSQRSLYEIHGISAPPRRQSRRGRIARRAITRLLAVLKRMKAAIEAELKPKVLETFDKIANEYKRRLARFDPADFELTSSPAAAAAG